MKILMIAIVILTALFVGMKIAKKNGKGCRVCIHGEKHEKHTGLCTIFIKKK